MRDGGLTPYHRRLLGLVSLATLFEGFDTVLLGLALPYLGREFGVDSAATGTAVGAIHFGTVLAFVPVRLADRYGRRPLLLLSADRFFERRTSVTTRARGSPKMPITLGSGRKPVKRYESERRRGLRLHLATGSL